MPKTVRQLRIFAASPNDLAADRESLRSIVDELNKGVAADKGFALELATWRDVAPDSGRPEQVILDQIGDFDIFVGIMGRRFGTTTGKHEAGTEEEYYAAYNRFITTGMPRIMFYFNQASAPPPRTTDEVDQLAKVLKFRQSIQDKGLHHEYSGRQEFLDRVRRDLTSVIINWHQSQKTTRAIEPSSITLQHWPIWRDAAISGSMPGQTVEATLLSNARHSVEFMTISGRSVFNGSLESAIKSKSKGFVFRLFLFDWNSPYFDAKMRDERRLTREEIEMARRKARDIAEQFLLLSRVTDARIEIKLHSEYPVWRLLIVDNEQAFVGHYPRDKRGYEGPMTLLQSEDSSGLFYPICQYFATRWDAAGAVLDHGDPRFRLESVRPQTPDR
jgi:hypothetical protein